MFRIVSRDADGVTVLDLDGQLVMGLQTQALCDCMRQLVAEQQARVLINIERVNYIDSSGVGELVACLTTMKKNGGLLKFACAGPFVADVLRAVKLHDVLDLFPTEQEALASFAD